MEKVEEYIDEHTMMCSNELDSPPRYEYGIEIKEYEPWLTPDDTRKVAAIAREETIKEVCEWLDNHTMLSEKWYIEDLKKHLEGKV